MELKGTRVASGVCSCRELFSLDRSVLPYRPKSAGKGLGVLEPRISVPEQFVPADPLSNHLGQVQQELGVGSQTGFVVFGLQDVPRHIGCELAALIHLILLS